MKSTQRHARTLIRALALLLGVALAPLGFLAPDAKAAPEGQLTWAVHWSLAPTWFDPGEHAGIVTPLVLFYAIDLMLRPR